MAKLTRKAAQDQYRLAVWRAYRVFDKELTGPRTKLVEESARLCSQANFHHVIEPTWAGFRDAVRQAKQRLFRAIRTAAYAFSSEQDCGPKPVMDAFVR